jgi:hypothetical protein
MQEEKETDEGKSGRKLADPKKTPPMEASMGF